MGSLSGLLHRPLSAAAAIAVAAASSDLPDRFGYSGSSDSFRAEKQSSDPLVKSSDDPQTRWCHNSVFWTLNFSVAARVRSFKAESSGPTRNSSQSFTRSHLLRSCATTVASVPMLQTLYQYANLAKSRESSDIASSMPSSSSDVLYRWHLPNPCAYGISGKSDCGMAKSQTVVVLLGWLGARQRHLKRYADWYTSRGYHVVTFTFPMEEVLSYRVGGKAEQNVELLADHLAGWVEEEEGKNLVFHTFSNTGWLMYGVILEKFQKQDLSLMEKIKGCIVDSAPVAAPDPQVWASGFSAAILKKQSIATKGLHNPDRSEMEPKVAASEVVLLGLLEKFFEVVLNLPSVSRRLSDVLDLLSMEQPRCPQLYIYSSSDRVIPAEAVESFVEWQRRAGHNVRACDFVSSPHVDHFRNNPNLYSSQLTTFLENHVLTCCKCSS